MRIAVVGSRTYLELWKVVEYVSSLPKNTVVVTGGATGVDRKAVVSAIDNNLEVQSFLPEWDKYGKRAGFERNTLIVNDCDEVVAFWDGKSRGTLDTISKAAQAGKKVTINPITRTRY